MNNEDQIPGAEMPEPVETNAVVIRENPTQLIRQATDVAGVCKEIVLKTACNIQGKKYVKCEGWMAIATAHGCLASSREVQKVEGGFTAIGEIRRIHDGAVLATAEGFVGRDEKRWKDAPEYACRAMAQTRAISRACRAAFAHVVVMMDAGLSTTPFEEVPEDGFEPAGRSGGYQRPPQPAPTQPSPQSGAKPPAKSGDVLPQEATKEQFQKFMAALNPVREPATEYFKRKGWLPDKPEAVLEELPIKHVPKTKREFGSIMAELEAWMDGEQQAPDWKSFPMPWGKNKDTPLGELDKKYLFGLFMNFEVEEEYDGKRKHEDAIAKDRKFREMLDEAGEHYEWKRE